MPFTHPAPASKLIHGRLTESSLQRMSASFPFLPSSAILSPDDSLLDDPHHQIVGDADEGNHLAALDQQPRPRRPEVADHDATIARHEGIGRLDVLMDHAMLVRDVQPPRELD